MFNLHCTFHLLRKSTFRRLGPISLASSIAFLFVHTWTWTLSSFLMLFEWIIEIYNKNWLLPARLVGCYNPLSRITIYILTPPMLYVLIFIHKWHAYHHGMSISSLILSMSGGIYIIMSTLNHNFQGNFI